MIRSAKISSGAICRVILLLCLGLCAPANATNLTGTFKNPDGSPVNGKIIFLLSQPARLNDQSAQIVPMVKIFVVTNGALEVGAFVYGNDVLVPSGTYYLVRLVDGNNNLLFEQKWSITGVNLDLGTLTPTTTGVVVPDPLIKNMASNQAVQGPVSFSAPVTAFSLTLNGNLNPGAPDSYSLGSSSAAWQELHARHWNSQFAVGNAGGIATAPVTMPSATVVATGGSIGPGTYYFKITYFNKNGETTASPTKTVMISSGATNRIHVVPGDFNWNTGCYGYIVYASNDNVNFYAQTPSGVVTDFQLSGPGGKTGHYVGLGSQGARFNSLTFSGSTPPTSNTAVIDPLQVALNASRNVTTPGDYPYKGGTLLVGSNQSSPYILLTTPLIVYAYDRIISTAHMGTHGDGQARILDLTFADPKLATVMQFGGSVSFENLSIISYSGNALMLLSGAGMQGRHYSLINNSFRTAVSTGNYAAVKMVGPIYNVHAINTYVRGDKAGLLWTNGAGGEVYFQGGRWDLNVSAVVNTTGWTDPDNGVNDAAFPNAMGPVMLRDILFEQGTGILLDAVNMQLELERCQFADTATAPGTDSFVKLGVDSYGIAGPPGPMIIRDTALPNSNNARVGMNIIAGAGAAAGVLVYGHSQIGNGGSTGSAISLDLNNQSVTRLAFYGSPSTGGNGATPAWSPSATSGKIINMAAGQDLTVVGGIDNLAGGLTRGWNEFRDRIVLAPTGGRANRKSFFMNGSLLELRQSDDTTVDFDVAATNGFMNLRGNFRVQAYGGLNPQFYVGPSGSTAVGGHVNLVNSGLVYMRNAANSADVRLIAGNASDQTIVGDTNGVCLSTATNCAPIKGNLSATGTLDFPSTPASACSDLTMTVTGAAVGDPVFLGTPNASVPAGGTFFAWVSAANAVTVRFCADGATRDPASGSFRATVVKF